MRQPVPGRVLPGATLVACLLLTACSSAAPPPTAPTSSPGAVSSGPASASVPEIPRASASSPLVFQDGGGVAVLTAGQAVRRVSTEAPTDQQHPDWSPDGRRLVFETAFSTLWVVDADGSGATAVLDCSTPCHSIQDAAWSPDGRTIALAAAETTDGSTTSRSAILALDVATGTVSTLYENTSRTAWLFSPRWSPDGRSLVVEEDTFASNRLDESSVVTTRIGIVPSTGPGGKIRYLATATGPEISSTDWSPTGDLVVYSRSGNLVTVAPDGTGERAVTSFDGRTRHAIQPTFAPDGATLVFTYVEGELGDGESATAAVVGLDGTGLATIGEGLTATHPRLRP